MTTSVATYLITLGVCDIGFLVFFIVSESLPTAVVDVKSTYAYAAFYSWVAYPTRNFFFTACVWLVVGVTVYLYVLIRFPLKGKEFYSYIQNT